MSSIDFTVDVFMLCGFAVCTACAAVTLRQYRPELAVEVSAAGGAVMLLAVTAQLSGVVSAVGEMFAESGADGSWLALILKITGISYMTQISAELCRDAGESALAAKTELCGRVLILTCALPAVLALIRLLTDMVDMV